MFSIGVGPAACIVLNAQELTFWQKGGGKLQDWSSTR